MRKLLFVLSLLIGASSCKQGSKDLGRNDGKWKNQLDSIMPYLGHRNWILIVDSAFPLQNSAGMEYINTNDNLLTVLKYTLSAIKHSGQVRPIVFSDKELGYIKTGQVTNIADFVDMKAKILKGQNVQTILHDSVFKKLDMQAKLFKVLVIKTNEKIPYSSVFLQLDCAYWDVKNEKEMRSRIGSK